MDWIRGAGEGLSGMTRVRSEPLKSMERSSQESRFGHVEFQIPFGHANGRVMQQIRYSRMELRWRSGVRCKFPGLILEVNAQGKKRGSRTLAFPLGPQELLASLNLTDQQKV